MGNFLSRYKAVILEQMFEKIDAVGRVAQGSV